MSQAQPPRPITGRKVLFMMVAFFGVVIGVNLIMMRLAIQTLPGTEVDSAYSASLAYERRSPPPAPRARATGRSMPMSNAAGRAAPRCKSRRATILAGRCLA